MKNKLVFAAVLVLALGFVLAGCKTESEGGGGGVGVPANLQGNWLRNSDGTERCLRITGSSWGRNSEFPVSDDELYYNIISATEDTIVYQHRLFKDEESFKWKVVGDTLTISESTQGNTGPDGIYTKQPE